MRILRLDGRVGQAVSPAALPALWVGQWHLSGTMANRREEAVLILLTGNNKSRAAASP